jgi:hypothetical protein
MYPSQNRSASQRRSRQAIAALAIFATTAQANNVIVQPSNLPIHSPSDPLPPLSMAKQMHIEYYPSNNEVAHVDPLSQAAANKPHIIKKNKAKTKTSHEPHSPRHTAEYLPQRLGSSQQQQQDSSQATKTQVILRPRPSYSTSNTRSIADKSEGKTIYYYDPSSLLSSVGSVESPTLTLPEVIYDANGNIKKLEEIHDGGKTEVFLEVKPKAVWGGDVSLDKLNKKLNWAQLKTVSATRGNVGSAAGNESDQLIVFGTIATMALLVGMLSAKRLRNKRLLEHCMEGDLEEEWDEKKLDSPSSAVTSRGNNYGERAALMGGRFGEPMGGKRESFGSSLHWRGDLEKFDV